MGLLTPFLGQAARTEGVAGILDIMKAIAPFLAVLVLVGAVTSQVSAAVADSIGTAGILVEVSQKRLAIPVAYAVAAKAAYHAAVTPTMISALGLSPRSGSRTRITPIPNIVGNRAKFLRPSHFKSSEKGTGDVAAGDLRTGPVLVGGVVGGIVDPFVKLRTRPHAVDQTSLGT